MTRKFQFVCAAAALPAMLICACAKTPRVGAYRVNPDIAHSAECMPSVVKARLDAAWETELPNLKKRLEEGVKAGQPTALYDAQMSVNNLLDAAAVCGDVKTLNDLAQYIVIPFGYLKKVGGIDTWADEKGSAMNELSVSQYLYLVSRAIDIYSGLPANKRTKAMKRLMTRAPAVVYAHYRKWIFLEPGFSVTPWGCRGSEELGKESEGRFYFTHKDFLRLKLEGKLKKDSKEPAYCNAVTDTDMWIPAGVVELLAAGKKAPGIVSIPKSDMAPIGDYLATAVELIESRMSGTKLKNFSNKKVTGADFDVGAWIGHPDYDYSGYTGASYPGGKKKKYSKRVSWDISHARRLVYVFVTLFENKDITGREFPTEETMSRLANQYAYGVFNRNFRLPLFSNFFDGGNGWYRVGYAGRKDFGYGPYKLSSAGMDGGYGFWKSCNADVELINSALWDMVNSENPEVKEHFATYYFSKAAENDALIHFLPVFARSSK